MQSALNDELKVPNTNKSDIECNGNLSNHEMTTENSFIDNSMAEKEDIGNSANSYSRMSGILEEFTELYTGKLMRINGREDEEKLKEKVGLLECWVKDLADQNRVLVATVEELEKEAARRVCLLQDKLDKMALATRESCVSLRDHQVQMNALLKRKASAEDDIKVLREQVLRLEAANAELLQQNSDLREKKSEVCSNRRELHHEQTFSENGSCKLQSPKKGADAEQHHQQAKQEQELQIEISAPPNFLTSWESLGEESEVGRLRNAVEALRKSQREANLVLTQRDEHIASLQAQLTEVHQKLSAAQAQVLNTTSTVHSLIDRGRHDSFEIIRRDDVIRQLLSPKFLRTFKAEDAKGSPGEPDEANTPKEDVELELSENIDLLASRLKELEEECERLRESSGGSCSHSRSQEHLNAFGSASWGQQPNNNSIWNQTFLSCHQRVAQVDTQTQTEVSNTEFRAETDKKNETLLKRFQDDDKIARLENQISEKNILIRELQNHLVLSREELRLKDQTMYNIEQKLECSRRNYDEKEEKMLYLTSQLTNLQLEVSRLYGNSQRLTQQLDNKSELVLKLESENRSLAQQLNDKSSALEGVHGRVSHLLTQIEAKTKQITEQKVTISSLQDALVATKLNCDKLQSQFDSESASNPSSSGRSFPAALRFGLGRMDTDLSLRFNESLKNLARERISVPNSINKDDIFLNSRSNSVTFPDAKNESNDLLRKSIDDFLKYGTPNSKEGRHSDSNTTILEPPSALFSPSSSFSSLNGTAPNGELKSPTDSGIGTEDVVCSTDSKEKASGRPIGSTFGKIFQI